MAATKDKSRDEELEDMKFMLGDKRGRRLLWRLLGICGLYQSVTLTYPAGILPEERQTYNGARQDIAQGLHTEIFAADPTGQSYQIMMSEAHARKLIADAERMASKSKPQKENDDETAPVA